VSRPSSGILDTSVFIAREQHRDLGDPPMQAHVSVVTLGELHVGVLNASNDVQRSQRAATLAVARSLGPVPVNEWVMDEWARLVDSCRRAGQMRAVKRMDSLIAATAICLGVPVVTQDDDYDQMALAHPALGVYRV
jgi:predicted nucleic acid-binding protein